jgi:hypothetical protein
MLSLHNITLKPAVFRGTEPWAMKKRNAEKLETAQMRFLRPLLGFKMLDCQGNYNVQNRLKTDNTQYVKTYQRNRPDHLKRIDTVRLPRVSLQFQPKERRDIGQPRER